MEQRRFGNSGLSVSVLSFGTMTIGGRDRFGKMGNLGVADTSRILDICREAGVTTLDTADVYSFGGAEEILGEALEGRRDEFVLVTKAYMRLGTGPHDVGLSRKHLIQACEASLRRLRTDYIDLYMGHQPDSCVPIEETLRAFDDLVQQGKVRYVGCSNHSAWQVMKALAVSDRAGPDPLRLPAGQLLAHRPRRRARDHPARARPVRGPDGVEPAARGAAHRQVPARRAPAGQPPQRARGAGHDRLRARLPDRRRADGDRRRRARSRRRRWRSTGC